jgi:prephenate dehydrogenase
LCPDEHTSPDAYAALHEVLTTLGARVVSLTREGHDEAVAIISHVPHFVAASLVELAVRHAGDQEALFRLAAGGFKDSTRIAAGSPALWTGIAFENPQAITHGLHEMQDILGQYAVALEESNRSDFTTLLDRAAKARQALPAKWIPATEDLLEVRIPLTDRPGIIAEVTTIASQVGCNIQSIEIDHITSSSADLVLILTDEGDVGKLSTQLIKAGFSVSFCPLSSKE